MRTLLDLRLEEQKREDCMTNPRMFIAIIPNIGPINGTFIDPYFGVFTVKGNPHEYMLDDEQLETIQAEFV